MQLGYDPARMLTRPHAHLAPSPARVRISRSRQDARRVGPGPVSPRMRQWLSAPGSLTARLRLHGTVRVEVLAQGRRRLWPQERRALGCCVGHVREVVLRIDERPAVWARSSVPARAVKGPWQAIRGLGTRPLAELLFSHRAVRRGPLQTLRLSAHDKAGAQLARQWAGLNTPPPPAGQRSLPPRWARHSLFRHHGQPLQVLEAFAPWVSARSCRPG